MRPGTSSTRATWRPAHRIVIWLSYWSTRRHAVIVSLLGIRHAVLAVNKIDLVGYSREAFEEIVATFAEFAVPLNFKKIATKGR